MLFDDNLHHRPRYHISQAAGYLNDPNGPIEIGRTTHMFFQSRRTTDLSAPVEWGHATSDDLLQWTVHAPAITPTPDGLDVDGCWSGNTLNTPDGLRAFYSGHDVTRPLERLVTALSRDGGATFGGPELMLPDPDADEGVRMLRDPFVWRDEHGLHMVAGSTVGDRAAVRLYDPAGGVAWRYVRDLASMQRSVVGGVDTGEGWECPQIIPLDDREIVLVGAWTFGGGPSTVLVFPVGDTSRLETFDAGDSFYAPSVMRDSSHGPVVFGWLRETRQPAWWHQAGWAGAISLPRRLWLEGDRTSPSVRSEPLPTLDRLRVGAAVAGDDAVIGAQAEIAIGHSSGVTRIAFGSDEWLDLELDTSANSLLIDRSRASRDDRADRDPIRISDAFDTGSGRPAARVLLDGSTLEIFTSAGRSATTRVYPLSAPPWRVAAGNGVLVWELRGAVVDSQDSTADRDAGGLPVVREA
jgi:beta-fructofuranosidase